MASSSPVTPNRPCAAPVARSGSAFDLLKFAGKKSTKMKNFSSWSRLRDERHCWSVFRSKGNRAKEPFCHGNALNMSLG